MKIDNLKKLIKKSGLTREHIAKTLGISYIYLHMIINGKRKATDKKEELIEFLKKNKAA